MRPWTAVLALRVVGSALQVSPRGRRRGEPAPPFVKPFLWIIAAGRPTGVLSLLAAVPAEGWPSGVYMSPGRPPDAGDGGAGGPRRHAARRDRRRERAAARPRGDPRPDHGRRRRLARGP